MILGVWNRSAPAGAELPGAGLFAAAGRGYPGWSGVRPACWSHDRVALCVFPARADGSAAAPRPLHSEDGRLTLVFVGRIYNAPAIRSSLASRHDLATDDSGEVLIHLYEDRPTDFLRDVNGKFAFALWDEAEQTLVLGRDRFGVESMFHADVGERIVFGSSLRALLSTGLVPLDLNHDAVVQYLLYCYNPGDETILRGVSRLPAGHLARIDRQHTRVQRYWHLSFARVERKPVPTYQEEFIELARDAIRIRLDPDKAPGVLLSGGTDSSAIVSMTSQMVETPMQSFSFRCRQGAFDESKYARFVAERYGTRHSEIEYDSDRLLLIEEAADWMEEPFCDIGIEVGTYLLGHTARDQVSYVFSGEGGDELFGGHPVYVADKVARVVDPFRHLLRPVTSLLQRIPDSKEKNNVQVKLKRFAYGLQFPRELLSHRWRIYYTPRELKQLCSQDFLSGCELDHLSDPVSRFVPDADGGDILSRCLYVDYYTLVSFYLRRLGLLKAFGVESRLPLLDYRLAEYAATVPSDLKIKGLSETKYIYRKILEKVLPREILYDRPKLGHSVPMKNWLREETRLSEWTGEVLSDESLRRRGLFDAAFVRRLVSEHRAKRENHSHRLWGLLVFELWLRSVERIRGTAPATNHE